MKAQVAELYATVQRLERREEELSTSLQRQSDTGALLAASRTLARWGAQLGQENRQLRAELAAVKARATAHAAHSRLGRWAAQAPVTAGAEVKGVAAPKVAKAVAVVTRLAGVAR